MDQDPDDFWVSPIEHVKEFFRALTRQAQLPATWPALLLLALSALGTGILAFDFAMTAWFDKKANLPPWAFIPSIFAAMFFVAVMSTIGGRRKSVLADLAKHARRLVPGTAPADDAIIGEVAAQAASMGIRKVPDVHLIEPGDHALAHAALAHAGFIDRGRVALHEIIVAECSAEDLRLIIRHELAHIKNRDGVVRAVVDVFKRAVDGIGKTALTYLFGLGGLFVVAMAALVGINLLFGQPVHQILSGPMGMWSLGAGAGVAVVVTMVSTVTAYALWVYRRQEFNADLMAAIGIGRQHVETGIRLLHLIDGDTAIPPRGFLAALRWRLLRTHPTPIEREERLRKLGLL